MSSMEERLRTVGEVAALLGVSVRTLHHWERKGLISPSLRTYADYRLYSDADIERLQLVQIYQATGMPLDDIRKALDEEHRRIDHLQRQRSLLMEKQAELDQMVAALDTLLEDAMNNDKLSVEEVSTILGDANFPVYQAEAEEAYAGTDDWEISQQTTANFSREDWENVKNETAELEARLAQAMQNGVQAGSAEANALAEEHRTLLSKFFPVNHSKHVLIARGYVADERFRTYYESRAEGLAEWLKNAIDANAISHGVDVEDTAWE